MGAKRAFYAFVATVAISAALLVMPLYRTGDLRATTFQVNRSGSYVLLVPVAISLLAFVGGRARMLAGALMLLFSLAGAFTVGLFYLPIAVALLWPAKRESAQ